MEDNKTKLGALIELNGEYYIQCPKAEDFNTPYIFWRNDVYEPLKGFFERKFYVDIHEIVVGKSNISILLNAYVNKKTIDALAECGIDICINTAPRYEDEVNKEYLCITFIHAIYEY